MYSDDGGGTWSVPALVTGYSGWTATSGAILQHSAGNLIMPIYGRDTGDTGDRAGVLISSNNGASWGVVRNITAQNGGYNEVTLIELPNASVDAYIRQEVTPSPVWKSNSTTVGVSWGALASCGFNTNPGRNTAVITAISKMMILFYRQPATSRSAYRTSTDLGVTWGSEQIYTALVGVYAGGFSIGNDLIGVGIAFENGANRADIYFAALTGT